MKSVVKLHEDAGFRVVGMTPSATAASQLESDTGCKSDTIAHYAYYWNKYDEALQLLYTATTDKDMKLAQKAIDKYSVFLPNSNTVIIIDEAGMVGVGDHKGRIPGGWDAITRAINNTGAKLIVTGDDHQFKPVDSGDVLRRLIYTLRGSESLCKLTEIVRQNIPWMRKASNYLAELNVSEALGLYENHGHIQEFTTRIDVYEDMARQYVRNITSMPDTKGMVIATTNKECDALNREIRSLLKQNGLLSQQDHFFRGEDRFTIGDRIVFTKNDRGFRTEYTAKNENFFVQNSMQAIIKEITPITIRDKETGKKINSHEIVAHVPDHDATVKFHSHNYKGFAHGYAVTGYKSQGATLDWVLAKLSRFMDAHALYVILTRHREEISLYYSNEDFKDYAHLVYSLSKVNVKDLVVDYSISDENKEYWQNVQDYKDTGRELTVLRAHMRTLDKIDKDELRRTREEYQYVEEDRKSWAKFILDNWDEHKDFVRQAGLTRESLEIAAGLKKRSMSRVEKEAQMIVEQYVSVSLEVRGLWRDIRRTHPGIRAKSHPEWSKFTEVRDQRGILANQICLNPILYRPFLKETAKNLAKADIGYATKDNKISYSLSTIKAQAEAHQSKMLQQELLRGDKANLAEKANLKILMAYTEARGHFGQMWRETRPKLTVLKGSLLEGSLEKEVSECIRMGMVRDGYALQIVEKQGEFETLANKVGIKLNFERLVEEATRGKLNNLLKTYQSSPELTAKLEAAFQINSLIRNESALEKKTIIAQVFQQGVQPKDIIRDALEWQKTKLFEGLTTEPERKLFLLLDEYGDQCKKANNLYHQCITDVKDKEGARPWYSTHYGSYKEACHSRNNLALEIFDQRDHAQVIAMAEAMGIRFKDVELDEIFSRCEQATRTRNIISYQNAKDPETKGQAAVAIKQMIEVEGRLPVEGCPSFEKRDKGVSSKTAQQAYHAGIDFKELQIIAFDYGRSCVLKGLSSEKEIDIYHALEAYESALRPANRAYKGCIDESKTKTTKDLEVKPWETGKFKEYISLVILQDEKAYELIKGYDVGSISKVAKEMGISVKKLDVEAHRHSLRQSLQTFTDGDRTNVPMAAYELLNWLDFDRHSDHKHTFKVLREQDFWPSNIENGLQQFFEKKRAWRHESERKAKRSTGIRNHKDGQSFEYKTITYERQLSFTAIDQQLKSRIFELSTHLIGNPTSRTSNQLRFGRKGSICVFTNGPKQGLYANHESGVYGGPLKMIEDQAGLTSAKEARDWATDWLGGKALVVEQRIIEKAPEVKQSKWTWTPITPVPKGLKNPDIEGNEYLNCKLEDGSKVDAQYAYRDEDSKLLGYVVRLVKPDGSKETPPLAYCHGKNSVNGNEFYAWQWKGFFTKERIPYGLEKLKQDPNKPILIVEGEKTCDAAQKLLPEYHVLSWMGGAGNVGKTNWQCLTGKEVVIWPDYDYDNGGQIAAEKLQKIVTQFNKEAAIGGHVGIVNLPPLTTDQPPLLKNKWDLADQLPEEWTIETVREMIKDANYSKDINIVHDQKTTKTLRNAHKEDINIEKAANQFIDLCVLYEGLSWNDPNDSKTLRQIESVAGKYMHSEDFRQRIESCGNEAVVERLHIEMEEQKHLLIQGNNTSGVTNEATLSPEDIGDYKVATNIEKAADQFIELCVLYESLNWDDPRDTETLRKIESVARKHMHSEEFRQRIETSKNEIAINRLEIEMEEQKQNMSQSMSRGI
jgi:hypothetical protein